MKKISFKDIKSREELLTRVKDGILSVGCFGNYVWEFLKNEPFNDCLQITVIYSSNYGTSSKIMYL